MEFLVTDLEDVRYRASVWNPDYVVSLLDVEFKSTLNFQHQASHYKAFFNDLEHPDYLSGPKLEQIRQILEFSQDFVKDSRVLVHCHAGISRSTAMTLGMMVQHGEKEMDALEHLLQIRPIATPNKLILQHIDTVLGSQLKTIVEAWCTISNDWWQEILNAQLTRSSVQLQELKTMQNQSFQDFRQRMEPE
ncbi:MAG: dual specificity protein phosphatase family protein [Planctomycetota bacterium]